MISKIVRFLIVTLAVLVGLVLVLIAVQSLANRRLPTASADPARLSEDDVARLREFVHLQTELGDEVWPGFGDWVIPAVLYNEENVFLVGLDNPAPGWVTIPQEQQMGGAWSPVEGLEIAGRPVYRQPLPANDQTPQSFTVRVGDEWAASMTTLEWTRVLMIDLIRQEVPPWLAEIFPYRLFTERLVAGSDQYLSLLIHEAFHAYQGEIVPERVAAAEASLRVDESYPWYEDAHVAAWQSEIDLLAQGAQARTTEETAALARDFLALRDERREAAGLTAAQIEMERQREWLEGLARYVELGIWREAATKAGYEPVEAMAAVEEFAGYDGYRERWQDEIEQMGRMADDRGDGRFYYTGMAIATMLDRLQPDWQNRAFEPGVFLEDLLRESLVDQAGS